MNFLAALLILIGMGFLLENYGIMKGILHLWPIIPLIIGIGFCMLFYKGKKKDIVMLGIGALVTLYSMFFLFLNFTSWKELAFLWPVFIILLGIMFIVLFFYAKKRVVLHIGILLIAIGISFILVFAVSARLWPITLVLAGISFIIIGVFERKR
jgi:hypothetical protein